MLPLPCGIGRGEVSFELSVLRMSLQRQPARAEVVERSAEDDVLPQPALEIVLPQRERDVRAIGGRPQHQAEVTIASDEGPGHHVAQRADGARVRDRAGDRRGGVLLLLLLLLLLLREGAPSSLAQEAEHQPDACQPSSWLLKGAVSDEVQPARV